MEATPLILCHLVFEDPTSHNVTLLGVFTQITVSGFPSPAANYSVYALLSGPPHEAGEVVLECRSLTTGELCSEDRSRTQIGASGKRHMHIRLGETRFPHAGDDRFSLSFEGQEIAEQIIPLVGGSS